jgi:hypothetical protein
MESTEQWTDKYRESRTIQEELRRRKMEVEHAKQEPKTSHPNTQRGDQRL